MTWQRQGRKAGAGLGAGAGAGAGLGAPGHSHSLSSLPVSPCPVWHPSRAPGSSTALTPAAGQRGDGEAPVYFSFCYFISLQWEQLRMSRINENNCWASVQVVNKEPQTLLSPTTKRCWHKKNSIFLCRNHLLNSLVLNRISCLLPLFPPPEFKNKSHKNIIFLPYMPY